MALIENKLIASGIASVIFVILPVWIFNIVPMSIKWKLVFTVGGVIGIYLALSMGTMKGLGGMRKR